MDRELNYKKEDLNSIYYEICERTNLETAQIIFDMFKGQQITFPLHLLNVKRVYDMILEEYDGSNAKDLAKKYNYSERTIRRIIKSSKEDN